MNGKTKCVLFAEYIFFSCTCIITECWKNNLEWLNVLFMILEDLLEWCFSVHAVTESSNCFDLFLFVEEWPGFDVPPVGSESLWDTEYNPLAAKWSTGTDAPTSLQVSPQLHKMPPNCFMNDEN